MIKVGGKRRVYGLGSAYTLNLPGAINRVNQIRGDLAKGIRIEDAINPVKDEPHVFMEVGQKCIDSRNELQNWVPRTYWMYTYTLKTYIAPFIGTKLVEDITKEDVISVIEPLWIDHNPTARHALFVIRLVLSYAKRQRWINGENVAEWKDGLDFDLPPPNKVHVTQHHFALTFLALSHVFRKIYNNPKAGVYKLCVAFGILTATRCREFIQARWDEIDFEKKVWSIPPKRRKDKKKEPFHIPLSSLAINLLRRIKTADDYEVVFTKRGGFMDRRMGRLIIKGISKEPKATMHGCRSTFREWCASTGKDPILSEKALMHATGNAVSQAYQRSDMCEERRDMMQDWADALLSSVPIKSERS